MSPKREPLTLVKIGGNIINDEASLSQVLQHFSKLEGRKLLVHGGGKAATELAERLDLPQTLIEGRRVTDEGSLRIAVMVYGGLINKSIVAALQARRVNAIGLSGSDLDLIRATKRAPEPIDYGWVGDITAINAQALTSLLNADITPVIAPITHDGEGQLLNTNADTIAHALSHALSNEFEVTLVYSFERNGVEINASEKSEVIRALTHSEYMRLKSSGTITGGMIPKLENAFRAMDSGVKEVVIGNARHLPSLLNGSSGTRIIHEN
jgi:acetylglutamate kinase